MEHQYFKGQVVDIDLGKPPKEIKGHEQAYLRPCVIIKSFRNLKLAIVVPLTSKKPKYNFYTIVKLTQGSGGLTTDSYVLCHQIRTISFDRVKHIRGKLNEKDILKIQSVLIDTLDV